MTEPSTPVRPHPHADRDSAEWWAALGRHELVLPRCAACGTWRWPPRAICGRCGSLDWSFAPASGHGTVASWVVNRHGFGGAFPLPSTVLLVRLAEQDDLLLPGGWSGAADGSGLAMGLAVVAGFEDVPAGPEPSGTDGGSDGGSDGDAGGDGAAVTLLTWRAVG